MSAIMRGVLHYVLGRVLRIGWCDACHCWQFQRWEWRGAFTTAPILCYACWRNSVEVA